MRESDENLMDDERNDILSRQAQELDRLRLIRFNLLNSLEKIKDVWTESTGVKIGTDIEGYLECLCMEMYLLASESIEDNRS